MARPNKYTIKEIAEIKLKITAEISEGKSLKSILDKNKDMPCRATVYTWLNDEHKDYDKEFLNNYTRSKEDSGDLDAEKIEEIAEKVLNKKYDPASARVAIDAYKWTAGKKKPKKYGDKLDVTSGNEKLEQNITIITSNKKDKDNLEKFAGE